MAEASTPWSHYNPVRVVSGSLALLANHVPAGCHVLVVTSAGFVRRGVVDTMRGLLPGREFTVYDGVQPNPDLMDLDAATARHAGAGIGMVIGLGGGSALDAAKALSVTLASTLRNPLAATFRDNQPPSWKSRLPLVTIPTTAGTGAEVTPFATVWDHGMHKKHSLAGPLMFPDVALLDASLSLTLPEEATLYPGLDAVSHALESLWNRNCTPISRALALESLKLTVDALPVVLRTPGDQPARAKMQTASLLSGLAISQTRTAVAHSVSYPLTTHFDVPHGLACSFTLPLLLEMNIERLSRSAGERELFEQVLAMLRGFDLGGRVRKYATPEQIVALKGEMVTPGRADNYNGGGMEDIEALVTRSVAGR